MPTPSDSSCSDVYCVRSDPSPVRLRPYCGDDKPELVALLNQIDRDTYEFIPWIEETVQQELEGASSIGLAVDERDRIVGLAYLRQEWWSELIEVWAQPGPKHELISNLLLDAIEGHTQTGRLTILIDPSERRLLALFAARGYTTESTSCHMIADLDRPRPVPPVAEGYLVRSLRPDQETQLIRLANDAYRLERLRAGILARWIREDPAFSLDCVRVAEYGGSLVAVVVGRSDLEYNRNYHTYRGYLGPAATLPAHRGKGLGKILTAQAMNLLHERGMETVCLHTWETNRPALGAIRDLGFRVGHQWKVLRKTLYSQ